jgi:hypothetical protein
VLEIAIEMETEWLYLVRPRQILSFGGQDSRIKAWISGGKDMNWGKVDMIVDRLLFRVYCIW